MFADANAKLNLGTGILIAVPIPKEQAPSGSLIESAIQMAIKEARLRIALAHQISRILVLFSSFSSDLFYLTVWISLFFNGNRDKNITGNAETPFLLARVNELTGGASLASSILSIVWHTILY